MRLGLVNIKEQLYHYFLGILGPKDKGPEKHVSCFACAVERQESNLIPDRRNDAQRARDKQAADALALAYSRVLDKKQMDPHAEQATYRRALAEVMNESTGPTA